MKDETTFIELVGNSPKARVLDFFLGSYMFDYSLSDICKHSNVGWTTLHTFWKDFEKIDFVKQTRTVGKAKMYKLNLQNKLVQALIKFDHALCKKHMDLEIEKQQMQIAK